MGEKALVVQNLTKKIKNKQIVDHVSFSIEKGEIFGLLGPNGAGKTTIIRMIVNLMRRTDGQVTINGYDLDRQLKDAIHEIGAIVENPEFYKYMSGYKNLKHYANMSKNKITEAEIQAVVKRVKLDHAINQKVKTYSLGMRQRLGVAQALLHKPSLLILDEPTNGLDPQGIREFREYLRALTKEGVSVLVSSHLLAEMQLMCDRFAIIEKGKLIHIASMNEIEQNDNTALDIIFEVDDKIKALEILKEQGFMKIGEVDENHIRVHVDKKGVANVNRLLVINDINVYEIKVETISLEDRFLQLTNQKNEEGN